MRTSDIERLACMLKALGNPIRFRIMQVLAERRTCMTYEIVQTTPLAQSTVSQHLKVLREAGLIRARSKGRQRAIASIRTACAGSKNKSRVGCLDAATARRA